MHTMLVKSGIVRFEPVPFEARLGFCDKQWVAGVAFSKP
jgi:hypothetical protein